MTFTDLPALNDSTSTTKDNTILMAVANISSSGSINNNNNNRSCEQSSTMAYVHKISNLGSSGKSVLAKLEEMDKITNYLLQQLQEHAGCIEELDYSFSSQKRSQGLLLFRSFMSLNLYCRILCPKIL